MTADEESGFEAAFAAGVGVTGRRAYRTLAGNLRRRLVPGERVAAVAPTSQHASLADEARRPGVGRPPGSPAVIVADLIGGFVLGAVCSTSAGHCCSASCSWRRSCLNSGAGKFREVTLARVGDVQVRTGKLGIATVRVSAGYGRHGHPHHQRVAETRRRAGR